VGNERASRAVERDMRRYAIPLVALAFLTAACGQRRSSEPSGSVEVTFEDLRRDPAAHDGERIRLQTGYYAARETSVLANEFAESYPPQVGPPEATIWVVATPPAACREEAGGVLWSTDGVIAEGTFRFQEDGGFGHLGQWQMALESATLTCLD
jgi:hypothetical protein